MKPYLAILAALLSFAAQAQEIPMTVSGKVTDSADGNPVPFASVHLEGTMVGVSTDSQGHYTITIPEDGILVFSSIGYKTMEVAVEGRKTLDVKLEPDSEYLEDGNLDHVYETLKNLDQTDEYQDEFIYMVSKLKRASY